ncbi:MAG: CDP-alcohol phosphatidyltransferase family protein [Nitrososphaerota archaeon]
MARGRLERAVTPFVDALARVGFTPNRLTLAGLAATGLATLSYYWGGFERVGLLLAGLLLAVGSFLDALDGVMARRQGSATPAGAFIDSFVDRVSDTLISLGYLMSGLVHPLPVLLMLATSMLVSYSRARGEALQVRVGDVGVGERGVRLLIAIAATLASYFHTYILTLSAVLITIVSAVTVVERVLHVLRSLGSPKSLGP